MNPEPVAITESQPFALREAAMLHQQITETVTRYEQAHRAIQSKPHRTEAGRNAEFNFARREAGAELQQHRHGMRRTRQFIADAKISARNLSAPAHNDTLPMEIRLYLRGLNVKERATTLHAALERKDGVTLGAVLHVPHFLSGVTVKEQAELAERFITAFHGAKLEELAAADTELAHAEKALESALADIEREVAA